MISVEEAYDLVLKNVPRLKKQFVHVSDALNRVLGEDIISSIDMPPFPQSAMDGYAVRFDKDLNSYKIVDEVPAGEADQRLALKAGEAVRIFTGAPVPIGANTVVRQEIVERIGDVIFFKGFVEKGQNIRGQAEQIEQGDLLIHKGTQITPAIVGLLCMVGIEKVEVYASPRIAVVATGNELVLPGNPLKHGEIYESNSLMLQAALKSNNFITEKSDIIGDSYEETFKRIKSLLSKVDVLVLTGGISVGDYDYVGKALLSLGVNQVFYKVKQKPGKPLFFGTYKGKLVFALPGNPAAALTGFYFYILPALHKMIGCFTIGLSFKEIPLSRNYTKKGDRAQFLKARYKNNQVEILGAQSSAMITSFVEANAIVYIPSEYSEIEQGDLVKTYFI